ncbi:globin [bacterium]|nr:globin [bacterium]
MLYEQLGGERFFRDLVSRFYVGVAQDPVLRPLYPEEDLGPAEERLRLFLMQYFGGPTTYSEQRGHPRLRMRHMGFAVGEAEQQAWLRHMRLSLDQAQLSPELEEPVWSYFLQAAQFLRNR